MSTPEQVALETQRRLAKDSKLVAYVNGAQLAVFDGDRSIRLTVGPCDNASSMLEEIGAALVPRPMPVPSPVEVNAAHARIQRILDASSTLMAPSRPPEAGGHTGEERWAASERLRVDLRMDPGASDAELARRAWDAVATWFNRLPEPPAEAVADSPDAVARETARRFNETTTLEAYVYGPRLVVFDGPKMFRGKVTAGDTPLSAMVDVVAMLADQPDHCDEVAPRVDPRTIDNETLWEVVAERYPLLYAVSFADLASNATVNGARIQRSAVRRDEWTDVSDVSEEDSQLLPLAQAIERAVARISAPRG